MIEQNTYCGGCEQWKDVTDRSHAKQVSKFLTDASELSENVSFSLSLRRKGRTILEMAARHGVQVGRMECLGPNMNCVSYNITQCQKPESYKPKHGIIISAN